MTVLIGDSISVGVGARLKALAPDVRVIAAIGKQLPWMASQEPNTLPGELVLLMGGTNDLVGFSAEHTFGRLKATIEALSKRGQRVIVGTLPPSSSPTLGPKIDEYNSLILGLSQVGKAAIGVDVPISADSVHPTIAGYDLMAKRWRATIEDARVNPATFNHGSTNASDSGKLLLGLGAVALVLYFLKK